MASALKKRPLTIPTQVEVIDGVEWLTFVYTAKGVSTNYCIRIDANSVDPQSLTVEFKTANSVYPKAFVNKEDYKGNRWEYETTVNDIGWRLTYLNPELIGKRGLLQRAVDSFRNRFPDSKSRRVARVEKSLEKKPNDGSPSIKKPKLKKQKKMIEVASPPADYFDAPVTPMTPLIQSQSVNGDPSPVKLTTPLKKRSLNTKLTSTSVYTSSPEIMKSCSRLIVETVRNSAPYQIRFTMDLETIPETVNPDFIERHHVYKKPTTEREHICNALAWKLAYLNRHQLEDNIELLQRAVDVYMEQNEEPQFAPRAGKRLMESVFPNTDNYH